MSAILAFDPGNVIVDVSDHVILLIIAVNAKQRGLHFLDFHGFHPFLIERCNLSPRLKTKLPLILIISNLL
jgi:hypothetical protein